MDLFASVGSLSNMIMMLFSVVGNYINHYLFQNDLIKVLSNEEEKIGCFCLINNTNYNRNLHTHLRDKPSPIDQGLSLNQSNTPIIIHDKEIQKPKHKMCFTQSQIFMISMQNFLSYLICGTICNSQLKKKYKMIKRCLLTYQDLLNLFKKIKDIEILQKIFMKNQKKLSDSILNKNKENEICHRDESKIVSNLALSLIKRNQKQKNMNE